MLDPHVTLGFIVACKEVRMERAQYTIGQVSNLAGISIRTLRHFEELGLLHPQRKQNGYRVYSSEDLERLQQVLLYRTCGMELAEIARMIDSPSFDPHDALAHHLKTLQARKSELETLIATVEKTIRSLEKGTAMTDKERFEGMKQEAIAANEAAYGKEARRRWGDAAVDAANEKLLAMDEATWNDMDALEAQIVETLKSALATGDTRSPEAKQLAAMHTRWIQMHWGEGAYSRETHLGLAQGYLADNRFRAYYDGRAGAGATEFLVKALMAWL